MEPAKSYRTERDPLGEKEVPQDAYYGIQTARAIENFPISGLRAHPEFVRATIEVKKAAALANLAVGALDRRIGQAIVKAADEALSGKFADQFVVDVYQAGAGTSHNMNANEVLANRAAEVLGGTRGDYRLVHPNDHVNMAQSTNDVFPTVMRIAAVKLSRRLEEALRVLEEALGEKARAFAALPKAGRTHLQDAVPLTLGNEFSAYAEAVRKGRERIAAASEELRELGIGGTAVGTGLNAHPRYRAEMIQALAAITGLPVRSAPNLFEAMQSMAPFAHLSSALRVFALDLTRIANDLRLLASGPRTGLAEITLPPVQPGSSIMPGKVNPVIAEATNMVAFAVIGNDLTIALATQAGQLELNVMMPVIAHHLNHSLEILANGVRMLADKCVRGITANPERCRGYAEGTAAMATILNPHIGYQQAAALAKESVATGKSLWEIVKERGLIPPDKLARILREAIPGGAPTRPDSGPDTGAPGTRAVAKGPRRRK